MSYAVKSQLNALEAELKQQRLWSTAPADPRLMSSSAPFSCDTMSLEQWLQYILIPRMQALLQANAALPDNISILPYAELAFKPLGTAADKLLHIIAGLEQSVRAAK